MRQNIYNIILTTFFVVIGCTLFAGNPDRQGEAGAGQLLITPWAKTAGLHTMNTSSIMGVDAIRLNPAGIARVEKTELAFGYTSYFSGSEISVNSFGLAQRIGKSAALGISIMAMDLGDFVATTEFQPEGTGAVFSPSFVNLAISYSFIFENKISVGATVRGITESTADVRASGFAFDAGVQYVTGDEDNFRFGISLRNIGSRMVYRGQGLGERLNNVAGSFDEFPLTYFQRSQDFELPSLLNIGMSYDFLFTEDLKLRVLGNFTANSFSQDQIGGGIEFGWKNILHLRGAYKYEVGQEIEATAPIYTGIAGGFGVNVPLNKEKMSNRIGIDYAYRQSRIWNGTHNITVSLNL